MLEVHVHEEVCDLAYFHNTKTLKIKFEKLRLLDYLNLDRSYQQYYR